LDSSSNANKAQGQANQLYGQLGATGTQNIGAYNQVPGTINSYAAGVNNNPLLSLFDNGTSNSPLVQAFGQAYGLNIPSGQAAPAPSATGAPTAQAAAPAGAAGQAGQQSLLPQNAYALTQPQQIELNTQWNTLNQAQQQATAAYQASFAERGGSDPQQMAAGVAAIQEQYAALAEQTSGAFAQNALTQRQTGLGDLLQGGQAASNAQNAGNLNVADLLMQLGGAGASQIGQAASGNQQNAQVQQQQSNSDMNGLLNLIGLGASGGLSSIFSTGGGVGQGSFPSTIAGGSGTGV
jgi:hypothetical protein